MCALPERKPLALRGAKSQGGRPKREAPESLVEFSQAAYGELRRIAGMLFKSQQPWRTLQPTALVHETFVRLADSGPDHYANRAQFFSIAGRTMRRLLVEEARRRAAGKRGC